jgi:hypothetical protein
MQRRQLVSELNLLGREISREWAKDNEVRKIHTSDLRRYHAQLDAASSAANGRGERLRATVASIWADCRKRMNAR